MIKISDIRCEHCVKREKDAGDCGPRDAAAHWVDAEGHVAVGVWLICLDCLAARSPDGSGFRAVGDL